MKNFIVARPETGECDSYYEKYISLVTDENILAALEKQIEETRDLLSGVSEEKAGFAYASGKWNIKQLVGHVIDTERIFAYRALRIARGDRTPIEGYEQDSYVENAGFDDRPLAGLTEEFAAVRKSNLYLFRTFSEPAWQRRGTANHCEISVRALVFIVAGHEIYHRNILRERYLAQ